MIDNSPSPDATSAPAFGLLDMALVLTRNLRIMVFVPLALAGVALIVALIIPSSYTATSRILAPAQQQSGSALLAAQLGAAASNLLGTAAGIRSPVDQYAALLRSRTVMDSVIQRFNLLERYNTTHIEDARINLEKHIRVGANAKDGIISIEVEDRDPKLAADIANGFVDSLRDLTNKLAVTEASQRRLFFEAQLKSIKEGLTKAEVALRQSGVSAATLKTVPQSALEGLARLKAQISAQEVKVSAMRSFMTEANPEFRLALQELAALRAELARSESSGTPSSEAGAEYVSRFREFKYFETLFELMARQYEGARIDEAREGSIVQVVDVAQVPSKPSSPRVVLTAVITWLLGLFLSASLLIAREVIRADSHSAEKWRRLASQLSGRS